MGIEDDAGILNAVVIPPPSPFGCPQKAELQGQDISDLGIRDGKGCEFPESFWASLHGVLGRERTF